MATTSRQSQRQVCWVHVINAAVDPETKPTEVGLVQACWRPHSITALPQPHSGYYAFLRAAMTLDGSARKEPHRWP